jgi:hypothetical protein
MQERHETDPREGPEGLVTVGEPGFQHTDGGNQKIYADQKPSGRRQDAVPLSMEDRILSPQELTHNNQSYTAFRSSRRRVPDEPPMAAAMAPRSRAPKPQMDACDTALAVVSAACLAVSSACWAVWVAC